MIVIDKKVKNNYVYICFDMDFYNSIDNDVDFYKNLERYYIKIFNIYDIGTHIIWFDSMSLSVDGYFSVGVIINYPLL